MEWRQKLKDAGFHDIENEKGQLKQYDRRSIAFDSRNEILAFFLKLDHWLNSPASSLIPLKHRQILEHYSQGLYFEEIGIEVCLSKPRIKQIVYKYKAIILRL